jgi:site-specific DNA recombinase
MRAVIYARYSSENQRDASIEDQVRLCKERIAIESWALVQVFKDRALSGSSTLRPGYQALLEGARNGAFDVVVAEALDRLSRDQEDVAGLFKRLRFLGIEIVTLSEGKISELHVGLKGTMNALFLKDLAAKTHRGLRGRVEAGRSGGGNAFGYDVVRRPDASDDSENGARRINAAEARIVRRIFRDYGAGISPKRIALSLNAAGVPGPRGGAWNASTINGNRERGTGVINNEIYTGKLVWNRLRYVRDPESGRRRSRLNSPNDIIITSVPDLRIVPEELWAAAKARQATLEHRSRSDPASLPTPFWSKQRPRYLFSGLMRCGVCGGGFSKISSAHFGCSAARNKGPTVCANLRTIRRDELENTVLDALRERLMDPELFKEFARSFVAEWNRLQATVTADHDARRVELDRTRLQIDRLVDAIAEGTPAAAVRDRLAALEVRRCALEPELAAPSPPAPRLHPNLAEVYRQKVAGLTQALQADDGAKVRQLVRGLVEQITLIPDGDHHRVEVRGELAAILRMAQGPGSAKSAGGDADTLAVQIKMVAGAGFEPAAFRL